MRKGDKIPKTFTLKVENSKTGLWMVTSPEIHGLLVADSDMRGAIREVPDAITAMQEALSDEALEAAAAPTGSTQNYTLGSCTGLSVCPAW
jgi:hypothetical protein